MMRPLFIVGMPRSGTTLLSLLLDAHSGLAVTPETHYFEKYWHKCERRNCRSDGARFESFVRYFLGRPELEAFGFSESRRSELVREILSGPASHRRILECVASRYARARGKERWGEKTPGHALFVDRILDAFPEAKILQIVRDPRDVALSMEKVPWGRGNLVEVAKAWRTCVTIPDREARLRGHNYLAVRYEDLLRERDSVLARVCDFLEVPFEPAMLASSKRAEGNFDPDLEPWKRKSLEPIDPGNVRKWEREMSPRRAALIEEIAADSMTRFGYDERPGLRTSGAGLYKALRRCENVLLLAGHWGRRISRRIARRAEW